MKKLTGKEKACLRGLAHSLNPVVHIGKNGLSDSVIAQLEDALERHELIKVKFIDWKDEKKELSEKIEDKLNCEIVGSIGHIYIFFRENADKEQRKIVIK
jgi:RNA-binding protein